MTMPTYAAGTIAVANGGTVVTGTGTIWSGVNVKEGDYFVRADGWAVVTEVTDPTHLKITPWLGATVAGGGSYTIEQNYVGRVVGVAAAQDVASLLSLLGGAPSLTSDNSYAGKQTIANVTDASSSASGGALTVAGGAAIAKRLFVGGAASLASTLAVAGAITGASTIACATAAMGSGIATGLFADTVNVAIRTYSGAAKIYFQTASGAATFGDWDSTRLSIATALSYGGVTLASSVVGTGSMVLSASPTLTGTLTAAAVTASGAIRFTGTTNSTDRTTGTVVIGNGTAGGLAVGGAVNAGLVNVISSQPGFIVADFRNTNAATGDYGIRVSVGSATSGTLFIFYDGAQSATQGSITHGAGSVTYGTASDIRGKPNREKLSLDLARATIDRLTIWDYDKDGNAIRGVGVIAQEAFKVNQTFARKGNTESEWWTAEKAAPVPYLIANMQQANARLDAIERRQMASH